MTQLKDFLKDSTEYPLVSAASLVNFCDVIGEYGIDGEQLLRRHQLHPNFIRLPNAQVRYDRLVSLLDESSLITQCPHFGLLLGEKIPVESIDLILLSSHSDTFGDALITLDKYQRIFGKGFTFEVGADGDSACWKYFHDDYLGGDLRALSDLAFTAMLAVLRFLLGDKLEVDKVTLDVPKPEDTTCYGAMLSTEYSFGEEYISLSFPKSLLGLPLSGNQRMRDIMIDYIDTQVVDDRKDLVGQVAHLINVLLPSGRCCIENVADVLGMHRRTLQKKLNALDITFKDILRDKREKKALYLLSRTELGVQDIADSLGYSEAANFLHAFKRWLGQSPSSWRKSQLQENILNVA
jgi:AraC-like DNA-binding protein